jgi:D-sedoheptulose 7-phosphate isomerase
MSSREYIKSFFEEIKECIAELDIGKIEQIADVLHSAWKNDKQVFILGNGGSASQASHMAADISKNTLGRVYDPRIKRFRIMALTDNVSLMTAYANDVGYEEVFSQQLRNLINEHDVLIVITGSGNSPNVIRAVEYARECNTITIGLLGFDGGKVRSMLDYEITVNSKNYGVIETVHPAIHHLMVGYFRQKIDNEKLVTR